MKKKKHPESRVSLGALPAVIFPYTAGTAGRRAHVPARRDTRYRLPPAAQSPARAAILRRSLVFSYTHVRVRPGYFSASDLDRESVASAVFFFISKFPRWVFAGGRGLADRRLVRSTWAVDSVGFFFLFHLRGLIRSAYRMNFSER